MAEPDSIPTAPNAAAPTAAVVELDLPCIHCSYNLRTQPVAGRCPECGRRVHDSLGLRTLQLAAPAWLARVALGLKLLLAAQIVLWLLPLIAILNGLLRLGASIQLGELLSLVETWLAWAATYYLLTIAGALLLAARDPLRPRDPLQLVMGGLAALSLSVGGLFAQLAYFDQNGASVPEEYLVLAGGVALVSIILLCAVAARVMWHYMARLPNRYRKWADTAAVLLGLFGLAATFAFGLIYVTLHRRAPPFWLIALTECGVAFFGVPAIVVFANAVAVLLAGVRWARRHNSHAALSREADDCAG